MGSLVRVSAIKRHNNTTVREYYETANSNVSLTTPSKAGADTVNTGLRIDLSDDDCAALPDALLNVERVV